MTDWLNPLVIGFSLIITFALVQSIIAWRTRPTYRRAADLLEELLADRELTDVDGKWLLAQGEWPAKWKFVLGAWAAPFIAIGGALLLAFSDFPDYDEESRRRTSRKVSEKAKTNDPDIAAVEAGLVTLRKDLNEKERERTKENIGADPRSGHLWDDPRGREYRSLMNQAELASAPISFAWIMLWAGAAFGLYHLLIPVARPFRRSGMVVAAKLTAFAVSHRVIGIVITRLL